MGTQTNFGGWWHFCTFVVGILGWFLANMGQQPQIILLVVEIIFGIFCNEIKGKENEIGLEIECEFKNINVNMNVDCDGYYYPAPRQSIVLKFIELIFMYLDF